MGYKIDILCSDGSPLGVCESTIQGDAFRVGVGGSELALLTMCRIWHDAGHTVTLYNNPWQQNGSVFAQCPIASFNPNDSRDFLIVFRSPNPKAIVAKGKKIWWSCDQYTVGDFRKFSEYMEKIVCISPFHAEYFSTTYGINNAIVIDLPVRLDEVVPAEKIPNRMIFTSVPDRGLPNLWRIYPKIRQYIPDLSLVITSDYRLWGASELNVQHKGRWVVHDGVQFIGAVPRSRYLQELAKADLMVYPCSYPELFCISMSEAQAAGVVCVSSTIGALSTTNFGHLFQLDTNDQRNDWVFIDRAREILANRVELNLQRDIIMRYARERFSPERISALWNKHIFEDEK